MKRTIYFFILLALGTALTSCKKSDISYENDFDKSYQSWQSFKASSNNSYRYKVNTSSWTGAASETILTVKNDKVIQRSYTATYIDQQTHKPVEYQTWVEDQSTLNTHTGGANTLTLEEIYQKARTEWLLKREHAKIYFETNNNGMISSCGYQEDGCMDDCFRGINISFIEKV